MRTHVLAGWLFTATMFVGGASLAQQAPSAANPPGKSGAVFNGVVIAVPNVETEVQFWSKLGAVRHDAAEGVSFEFPDMTVAVIKGSGVGGTAGTVIDHIGLQLPDSKEGMARYQSLGLPTEPSGIVPGLDFLVSPNGVRVELGQEPTLTIPVRGHHVHYFLPAPLEAQAWYAKYFGAIPGKRGRFDAADITASKTVMNLTFALAEQARTPTKGRALDRIRISVADVDAAVRQLRSDNVAVEEVRQNSAIVVDPWGTRIELRKL